MKLKVLWIDDNQRILDLSIPNLERYGFCVVGETSPKIGIKQLEDNLADYSLVLLDLKMPGIDGIDVYKELIRIKPQMPIFVVSGQLDEDEWVKKIENLESYGLKIHTIPKPFPVDRSKKYGKIIENLKNAQTEYVKNRDIDPFCISIKSFRSLAYNEKERIEEIAANRNYDFIKKYFQNYPEDDWIAISKQACNVVKTGIKADEPFEDEKEALDEENGHPVFIYARPINIDEIDKPEHGNIFVKWDCTSKQDDFYPTISIWFTDDQMLTFHLDTGSEYSFINWDLMLKNSLVKTAKSAATNGTLQRKPYRYFRNRIKCEVEGSDGFKTVILKFEGVKQWDKSPLTEKYKNRDGLIGRDFLLDKQKYRHDTWYEVVDQPKNE